MSRDEAHLRSHPTPTGEENLGGHPPKPRPAALCPNWGREFGGTPPKPPACGALRYFRAYPRAIAGLALLPYFLQGQAQKIIKWAGSQVLAATQAHCDLARLRLLVSHYQHVGDFL